MPMIRHNRHYRYCGKVWRYVLIKSFGQVRSVFNIYTVFSMELTRCDWCLNHPLYIKYHDEEWGVQTADDKVLFEFIILESAQAGLSWLTILKRREGYRKAFANFDVSKVANFSTNKVNNLLNDTSIIRNRLKIESAINNAKAFIEIQAAFGSFYNYSQQFVSSKRVINKWNSVTEIPTTSEAAISFSNDLKKRGFKFVGPTIMYAHMQATGMVNDHLANCFRHDLV